MITPGELAIIDQVLPVTGVVFDVGAHQGDWTRAVFDRRPGIVAHAFEPLPAAYEKLTSAFTAEITAGRLIANRTAVGDSPGTATFHIYDTAPDFSTFHRRLAVEKQSNLAPPRPVDVAVTTIDDYCAAKGIDHVHFLKIDTEGHELSALRGATRLLQSAAIDYIQFEYGGTYLDAGITLRQVFDHLTSFEYVVVKLQGTTLRHLAQFQPQEEDFAYANFIAAARRQVSFR